MRLERRREIKGKSARVEDRGREREEERDGDKSETQSPA